MQVFLHTLFLEYATETGENKCKAVFYTYKQIGMQSLELFWPCSILAKNLGDVLARGAFRPGLKGLEALLIEGLRVWQVWQAKCSNVQFILFLPVFNSIFHVQLFVQYSTFIQYSMLQFHSTLHSIFNYLFNVQLFIQHLIIYSMFNVFSNM